MSLQYCTLSKLNLKVNMITPLKVKLQIQKDLSMIYVTANSVKADLEF